jgi:hypothetical protein
LFLLVFIAKNEEANEARFIKTVHLRLETVVHEVKSATKKSRTLGGGDVGKKTWFRKTHGNT